MVIIYGEKKITNTQASGHLLSRHRTQKERIREKKEKLIGLFSKEYTEKIKKQENKHLKEIARISEERAEKILKKLENK